MKIMKPYIAWCLMIAVLFAPAKADDGLSPAGIIAIVAGAGILGTVLYCCCMYYLCRCCWLVCNKDGASVTVVQQSQMPAPSAQPIIFAERSPVGMGASQMPVCGNISSSQMPVCGNMGSSQMRSYFNMGSSQMPGCGNMGSNQVPGSGNMGSSGVNAYENMDSRQEPECGDKMRLLSPPPYIV